MIFFLFCAVLSLDSIFDRPELVPAHYGVYVLNLKTDEVVYARNSQKLLIPASNMKIVTTGAALTYLGPNFRFVTKLAITGTVVEGKLVGDIVLIGGGDPTFNRYDLEQFVQTIKAHRITEVVGNIIVDDSYFTEMSLNGNNFRFERLPVGWAWHYLDARYAPEISAMTFNKNVVNVHMEGTTLNEHANVSIQPLTSYVTLRSDMITKEGADSVIILRLPEENEILVSGGIPQERILNIEVAVKNPALFACHYFREQLVAEGVRCYGDIEQRSERTMVHTASYTVIDSVMSPPLEDVLLETNTESVNLYAEMFLKILGVRQNNEGSFRAGIEVIERFLALCGAEVGASSIWDGSGLSRHNLISSYHMVLVLRYMYLSQHSAPFFELLPTSGEGTLERRFKDLNGSLRAKTGSLHAVSCLSGYLRFGDTDYCFSMMFNNFTCSRKNIEEIQESVIYALQQYLAPETIMSEEK